MAERTPPNDYPHDYTRIKCLMEQFATERRAYINLNRELQKLCVHADEFGFFDDQAIEDEVTSLLELRASQLTRCTSTYRATQEELEKISLSPAANKRPCLDDEAKLQN